MLSTLLSNFGLAFGLWLAVWIATGAALLALAVRARSRAAALLRPSMRVIAVGSAFSIVAATAVPYTWPPVRYGLGDLVLVPGRGGMGDLAQILAAPGSLAAILLAANVLLYIPLTLAAAVGWPQRSATILLAALLLSLSVETVQYLVLERVAATDDVILNMTGAVMGLAAGIAIRNQLSERD